MNALGNLFTSEEVLSALKNIFPTKSPSPDGFRAIFYQKYKAIVGADVLNVLLGFLNGSLDISTLNTFMVLISKTKDPKKVSKCCPISLCNVVYKLI